MQTGTGLRITSASVRAMLERWANSAWDIGYTYCYNISSTSPEVENMTFRRVDYSTIGPGGDVYNTSSDSSLVGQRVGLGYGGCFYTYQDPNITRPVATTYRLTFDYAPAGSSKPFSQSMSGTISSTVPPQPFVRSVTLTDDITEGQKIIRQPRPITFTVSNVEGGAPPFLYQWRLNGFVLRDWDPNPVLTWDGATLNGRPAGSGSYAMVVAVRRASWPDQEGGAVVNFLYLFP